MNDIVSHPSHYTKGSIEVWDFIVDQELDYLSGNVIKYICRHKHKGNPLLDLQKAKAYIERLINEYPQPTTNPDECPSLPQIVSTDSEADAFVKKYGDKMPNHWKKHLGKVQ